MAINFNTSPYHDDYDETKDFHRVLFKPGFAVQARELTQLQTILQNQVSRFGNHIFKDGSKVLGAELFKDTNVKSVRLQSTYGGSTIDVAAMADLYVKGPTSNVIGLVKHTYNIDVPDIGDPHTIVIKPLNTSNSSVFSSNETLQFYETYIDALTGANLVTSVNASTYIDTTNTKTGSCSEFSPLITLDSTTSIAVGDLVTATGITKTLYVIAVVSSTVVKVNEYVGVDLSYQSFVFTKKNTTPTLEVSVTDGVFYKNGYFIRVGSQSVVPSKYNAYPNASVGLSVVESIVTSDEDSSLLDPAVGSYNYFAPGADRYKFNLDLTSVDVIDEAANLTSNPNYIELLRLKDGVTYKSNDVAIYSDLERSLARRTYDESGNYVVKNFILNLNLTSDAATTIDADILPGKAYIKGFEIETIAPTRLQIEKARDTESVTGYDISPFYGNYVIVDSPYLLPALGANVELHTSNTYSYSTRVGTALVKQIQNHADSNALYKLFLNDINLSSNTFSNVRAVIGISNNTYNLANTTFLANVNSTGIASNATQIYDGGYDSLVFPLPQGYINSVTSTSYQFRRKFTDISFSAGVATILTNSAAEDFVGGTGVLPATTAKTYYYVVVKTSSGTFTKGQFIKMDATGRSVNIAVVSSGSVGQATLTLGDGTFNGTCDIYATIEVQGDTRKSKTLNSNTIATLNLANANVYYSLSKSDVYQARAIYAFANTASNVYVGVWSSATTYSTGNIVSYSGLAYQANTSTLNTIPLGNTASWFPMVKETAASYTIDRGQRDNYYGHGRVKYNGASGRGNVLVFFDYFTHSTPGYGYFTRDSYSIPYSTIPTYTTQKTGTTFNLRDCYDFRPRRTDGSSSLTFDTYQIPLPYETIESDYSYYLGRIDKIALAPNGDFKVIKGISSFINPALPTDDADAMTLFVLKIPPYTFTPGSISVEYINRRRYTMKDIGQIDQRLKSVEYYTSLNMLEKDALASTVLDNTNSALFKNGYLVDSFAGHSVGDVKNTDYRAAIDPLGGYCRATFTANSISYTFSSAANPDVTNTGNLITFPYVEQPFIQQMVASKTLNVNPFNVVKWIGALTLSPSSDVWYETNSRPIINIVQGGDKDALLVFNNTGTQWNDWQLNWSGQDMVNSG